MFPRTPPSPCPVPSPAAEGGGTVSNTFLFFAGQINYVQLLDMPPHPPVPLSRTQLSCQRGLGAISTAFLFYRGRPMLFTSLTFPRMPPSPCPVPSPAARGGVIVSTIFLCLSGQINCVELLDVPPHPPVPLSRAQPGCKGGGEAELQVVVLATLQYSPAPPKPPSTPEWWRG